MSDRITFAGKVEAEGRRLKGSVTLAGSRTFRDGEWVEVDPKALMKADASNVVATIDHDPTRVTGRTFNSTLTVNRTETGLDYETADLPNTTYANDALELARGGYFGGTSFTVEGIRSKFSTNPEDGLRVRTINSIKRLVDVAIVMDPAFSTSTAAAFSKESAMTEENEDQKVPQKAVVATAEPPKSGKEEWASFAADKPTEHIQNVMDQLFENSKGNLRGVELDQYEGFALELDRRSKEDAETKRRAENMAAFHNMRLGKAPKAPEASSELFASKDYEMAFKKYLRTGRSSEMEQFALAVAGDGSQGGFTVPDGFLNKITERLKAFGGIAGVADEISTSSGESLRWPTNDDTSNVAAVAAEGVAGTAGADLVFDSIELGAFSYDANGASNLPVKVSLELLQDSAINMEDFIGRKLGERIGRKQAVHLATGMGGTEPMGLLSKSADTMTATVVSLAGPEHIFQVDQAYRVGGNCRWVMSDTTLAKLWTAQATTNEPLFQPGRTLDGKPFDAFFGYPITLDQAAGDLVAFGDIRRGYIVRRVRGVQVLVDPYSYQSTRQIGYHAWARMDANIQDSYAYSVSSWSGVSADS